MQWQVRQVKPKRYRRLRRQDYGKGEADPASIAADIERLLIRFAEVAHELDPEDKYRAKGVVISGWLDGGDIHCYPFYTDDPVKRDEEFAVSVESPPLGQLWRDLDEISERDEDHYDAATERLECFVIGVVREAYRRVRASEAWPPRWRHEQFRALYVPLDDFERIREL